jgi:hypothetical protein
VENESNIGLWHKKNHPIDFAQILNYYRVSARSISALNLSRVVARFISFEPATQASCFSYRVQKGASSRFSFCDVYNVCNVAIPPSHFNGGFLYFAGLPYNSAPLQEPWALAGDSSTSLQACHEILHWPLLTGPLLTGPLQLCHFPPASASAIED